MNLQVLPELLAVVRLDPDSPIPRWASSAKWVSITRTRDELSIVCPVAKVPAGLSCEHPFRAIAAVGPLDFSLTGILASLAVPLAEARISIFALSTFDTDYVLVRENALAAALRALRAAGHTVIR